MTLAFKVRAMTTKPPPIPPSNRSPKEHGQARPRPTETGRRKGGAPNLKEQGRQGNVAQNTTNQGYQQDR